MTQKLEKHYKHPALYRHYYSYNRAQLTHINITNHVLITARGIEFDAKGLTLEQLIDKLSIDPNYEQAFSDWHTNYPAGDKVSQDFVNIYLKRNNIQISQPLHTL